MVLFSSNNRVDQVEKLLGEELEVLVIGGGITGAGIALDAVTRGMRVGLIEMQDFAAGTSSRSTKLVHGGLRYLKQLEVKLVSEVGKERAIVFENGPHVTTPEWMLLPFYKKGSFGPLSTKLGLLTYDLLAGVQKKERRKMLSAHEAKKIEPLLNEKGLKGAGYYVEYKTDDARLTIEVIKKAVEKGAFTMNYMKATNFIYNEKNKVIGVKIEDQITGETYECFAKKVINATGPWVYELRELDQSKHGKTLYLTKGVHLVFDHDVFPLQQAIYFDVPDGRMIFAIPRQNKVYVGTTDTTYRDHIAYPQVTESDRDYLLQAVNLMFPDLELTDDDVDSSWAGIRPLIAEDGKSPDEISRKDEMILSSSGLISIAGGKLTGYRQMAEKVVNLVVRQFKEEIGILYSQSETAKIPISGGDVGGSEGFPTFIKNKVSRGMYFGLSHREAIYLIKRYGSNVDIIFQLYVRGLSEARKENLDPVTFAMLNYAIEYEAAYKPVDFFIRRTGALYFDISWLKRHRHNVIRYMNNKLGWTEAQKQQYRIELEQCLIEATTPQS